MSKVIVDKIVAEKTTKNGKQFYEVIGKIDGDMDKFDMWFKPEVGHEYDGEIKETQFGKSFSKAGGTGFGGGGSRFNDPETRKEIIRQSSLAQAVAYASKQVEFMEPSKAIEYLTGKQVLQIATYFAAYAEGRLTVAMTDEEAIRAIHGPGHFEPADATKAAHEEKKEEPAKPKKSFDKMPEEDDHLIHSQDIATGEKFTIDIDDFDKWMEEKEANEQK